MTKPHPVNITTSMSYDPPSLEIRAGETVEWTSRDNGDVHTVTHDNEPRAFASDVLNGGDQFRHTFKDTGDYPYFCEVHGKGMSGNIKVK